MEKLFTVAGTSRRNGTVKFRFSNDLKGRLPMLERTGHTEINLIELPTAMTKEAAVAYLEEQGFTVDAKPAKKPKSTAQAPALDAETAERVAALRAELEDDGEDTSTMTDAFLAEVLRREQAAQDAEAVATMENEGAAQ